MNDLTTEGAVAPADDNALYASIINGNELPSDPPEPASEHVEPAPVANPAPEPAIPPARLREEADARRAAERERDELRGRLAAFERMQPQSKQPEAQRVDPVDRVLSDPTGLIREEAQQLVDPFNQQMAQLREFYSRRDAIREHGQEKVTTAFQALDQAARSGDLEAQATVSRVKQSMDPFGDIVRWHQQSVTLAETKGDLDAYRKRILEDALKDPEFQKQVLAATRQTAQQAGNVVARPTVSAPPSLNRIGSAALPDNQADVSDEDLFASTTRRKRATPG